MTNIKFLSEATIAKISAGEVIERPVSVVKELVENAIDAGAILIKIELENGGKNLIKITDNGVGMHKEDLSICTNKHTTSKLDESDLMNINSFGFRGEALYSIATISKLSIQTKQQNSLHGYILSITGNKNKKIEKTFCDTGTEIITRDLFYSIPARLKFLKSDNYELNLIVNHIKHISLFHSNIKFIIKHNEKILLDLAISNHQNRIKQVLSVQENLFKIKGLENNNIKISGYISDHNISSSNKNEQLFFVNKRCVKDKIFYSAIKSVYVNILPSNKYPIIILFIELPVHDVDVNVHPSKTEIRFRNNIMVRDGIINSMKLTLDQYSIDNNSSKIEQTRSSEQVNTINSTNDSPRVADVFLLNNTDLHMRQNNTSYMKQKNHFSQFNRSASSFNTKISSDVDRSNTTKSATPIQQNPNSPSPTSQQMGIESASCSKQTDFIAQKNQKFSPLKNKLDDSIIEFSQIFINLFDRYCIFEIKEKFYFLENNKLIKYMSNHNHIQHNKITQSDIQYIKKEWDQLCNHNIIQEYTANNLMFTK